MIDPAPPTATGDDCPAVSRGKVLGLLAHHPAGKGARLTFYRELYYSFQPRQLVFIFEERKT